MRRTFARFTLTAMAAAATALVASMQVQALGLGEIDVSSDLNQRFVATIPLTEISAEDLETVSVSVAPNESFDRAGIERADYLSSLSFEIKNDRGRPRVVVTSNQIAREPVLDLLVQARWSGGKIQRDYTILLDPPESAAARPPPQPVAPPVPAPYAPVVAAATPRPAPAPVPVPAPAKPVAAKPVVPVGGEFYQTPTEAKTVYKPTAATKPVAGAVNDPAFDSATSSYGPVAPKETLWSIATKVRPGPSVTMDQVLLALAEANPESIQLGTIVSKGVTLRVPSAERIKATPASAATARLAALRAGKAVAGKPAIKAPVEKRASPAPSNAVSAPVAPAVKPAEVAKPAPAIATPPPASPPPAQTPPPAAALAPPATTPAAPVPAASTPAAPAPAVTPSPAESATSPAVPAPTTAAVGAAAVPPPAPASSEAATVATAAPPVPAPAVTPPVPEVVKSPLAQPLAAESEAGFLDEYGSLLGFGALTLLLGGAAFAFSRSRKAVPVGTGSASPFKPGEVKTVTASAGGAGALGKLGDTTRLSDTQVTAPRILAADSTQQMTQPLGASLPVMAAAPAAHDATLVLTQEVAAGLSQTGKPSVMSGGSDSFDRTTQIQVDTLHIDLDDNDPASEADFHLAYGLYDEAILLLKNAVEKQPQRTDLKVKLAETYFAAGRPMEFQESAEELKDKLSAGEWSKFAIMGAQICPGVALFQATDADGGLDADFDLAFDEPAPAKAPASNTVEFALLDDAVRPKPAVPLELDIEDGNALKVGSTSLPPSSLDDDASIDFMLGQSLTPLGAGLKSSDPNSLAFNLDAPALDIAIPKLENAEPKPALLSFADFEDHPTLTPAGSSLSMSLQDLEVSITPRQASAESLDDELNTKLDLARAYVEMGDNDMARSLLLEVQQQGSARHQQEAATLLQRLPA